MTNIITDINEYKSKFKDKKARTVTFYGHKFIDRDDGKDYQFSVKVHVENGDVHGIIKVIIENGGMPYTFGDKTIFIPWPCAAVVIRDE
jgi:hypothetical protein